MDFVRLLAALIQARDWDLTAEIKLRKGWRPLLFRLCSADGPRSRVLAPGLFDSAIEAALAEKIGAERDGWRLSREGAVLEAGAYTRFPRSAAASAANPGRWPTVRP